MVSLSFMLCLELSEFCGYLAFIQAYLHILLGYDSEILII